MSEALLRFGYTERESAFLRLASLLSGYFVPRHFNEFIRKKSGALAQCFVARGLRLGHFKVLPSLGGRKVYHCAGSQLYAALGEPDSRNRREHRPETIRLRLMALDFALVEQDASWLLTEREKVRFFTARGFTEAELPWVLFAGRTRRFFVEKQPISFSDSGVTAFTFIDGGARGFSQWELFLEGHRTLLQRLHSVALVFASCQPGRFQAAGRLLRRVLGESTAGRLDVERLKRFFVSRRLFEEKRYERFDQRGLDELREAKRVFARPDFDRLYEQWRERGDAVLAELAPSRIVFRTAILPHLYEWLSPIQTYERRA